MAKYYWFKMQKDFLSDLNVKKLRLRENGDTLVVIYLKMLLLSLSGGGYIEFDGIDDVIFDLSLLLDEQVTLIKTALDTMVSYGMVILEDGRRLFLPAAAQNTGSETPSAARMRESRARDKNAQCAHNVQKGDTEIEIEIEKETETEIHTEEEEEGAAAAKGEITLPLINDNVFSVTEEYREELTRLFPDLNIPKELRNMKSWLLSNPKKGKTEKTIRQFISSWLIRESKTAPPKKAEPRETPSRASYNIDLASQQMKTQVPQLRKRE